MADNVVFLQELLFKVFRDVIVRGASISVFSVAPGAFGRKLVRSEKTVPCSAWIE